MTNDPFSEQSAKFLQALDFASEMDAKEKEHQAQLQSLFLSLLGVMDSFDRFLVSIKNIEEPTPEQVATWLRTIQLIAKQQERVLQEVGLTPIVCLGKIVDPQQDEIVEVQEVDEMENDTIIEVVSRGYQWNGQLLRRPQVIIARNTKKGE